MLTAGFFAADDRPSPRGLVEGLAQALGGEGPPAVRLDTGRLLILEAAAAGTAAEEARTSARFDAADAELTLSRATFGPRPLYYRELAEGLAFSSRLAPLARLQGTAPLRPAAVQELLELQFTTGRETVFADIFRVRPGESVRVRGGRIVGRGREAGALEEAVAPRSESEAIEAFDAALVEALRLRIEAGGPGDLVTTGEVEGLALAVGLRRLSPGAGRVRLYSDAPRGAEARGRLGRLGLLGAHVEAVTVTGELFWTVLPSVVAAIDDPAADYFSVVLHLLATGAARGPGHIVSPVGANELFAGYSRYRRNQRPSVLGGRALRARGHLEGFRVLKEEDDHWRDGIAAAEIRLRSRPLTALQRAQALDCGDWLVADVLNVHERVFGAAGLAVSAPYLDERLARLAFTLPDRLKVRGRHGKYLIRRWLERVAPDLEPFGPRARPRIPIARLLAHEVGRIAPALARSQALLAYCDAGAVASLCDRLARTGNRRAGIAVWVLVFFALWHAIHVEGKAPEGSVFDILA
ncbi:MAG: hypothetical protein H6923_01940 [Alphaproteobacteria bacterium]|nr:hypothetical protein [Alphaproteobacteria bacterium]